MTDRRLPGPAVKWSVFGASASLMIASQGLKSMLVRVAPRVGLVLECRARTPCTANGTNLAGQQADA